MFALFLEYDTLTGGRPRYRLQLAQHCYQARVSIRSSPRTDLYNRQSTRCASSDGLVCLCKWEMSLRAVLLRHLIASQTLDKMYSSTLGLPCMMKPDDFEIRELGTKDFDTFDDEQELFIQFIRLNGLIAKMVEVCRRKGESDASQAAYSILRSLQEWIKQLPQRFRLYHDGDQRRYQREVYELHINYFIVIIKFFHLCGHAVHATITSPVALIASSCLSRLYEEILCREEIGYLLPVHNWFISVGSLPQIHALSRRFYSDDTCEEELGILRKALQTMGIKWPQAQNLRNAVDRLQKRRVATSKADQDRPDVAEAREGDYSEFLSYGHSSILNGFIRELFPFPQSMCPRISMLDSIDPVPGFGGNMDAGSLFLDEDYHLDWAMDLADIDGASGMYDNSSSLYHTGNSLNI
ncbi:hypothetical protein PHISCL_01997 [Aspergillus sclerotialis]|uniref:C6 transcription factor n=1 Tax=Aspergillus sclerotialis TaxID=2070753 RepID=A0A3A2ZSG2_9EURO|nr:hypothetical protein PHISCL_01997 [Aspergillus sclerotialis]